MLSDGLAQFRNAPVGHGKQQLFAQIQHDLPLQTAPDREGEFVCRAAGQIHLKTAAGRHGKRRVRRCFRETFRFLYEIANLFNASDIPLCQKLVIGSFHRDFAYFQIGAQGPFGGKLLPGHQDAGENILADAPVQSLVERDTGRFFEFVG